MERKTHHNNIKYFLLLLKIKIDCKIDCKIDYIYLGILYTYINN